MDPGLLLPLDHVFVLVFNHCSAHVVVQLLLLQVKVFLCLGELSSDGVYHYLLLFHNCEERSFLTESALDFLRLSLTLELHLHQIVFKAFLLKLELVVFGLENSSVISFLFDVFSILDKQFIFVDFELISILSEVE